MTKDELIELIELHDPPEDYPVWPLIVEFVAAWMQSFVHDGFFTADQIAAWREEMA